MELETAANGLVIASTNWSEEAEDLVTSGDVTGAISLLESVVARLESLGCHDHDSQSTRLQLSSALTDLSRIYASQGFSFKSDEVAARAAVVSHRALQDFPSRGSPIGQHEDGVVSTSLPASDGAGSVLPNSEGELQKSKGLLIGDGVGSASEEASDDDWEVIADRAPNELLPAESLPNVAKMSLVNDKLPAPKRRGRGTFSYQKQKLYSDRLLDNSDGNEVVDEDPDGNTGSHSREIHYDYGSRHVLVLADFPPTTRTLELEKFLEDFKSRGVVIQWVNDTTALAVFRTPALAHEALNSIQFPFTLREVNEEDNFLSSISAADLEPPRPRPQTSTRTAQRLIAQGMGLKLSTSFGSRELRKQEESRKDRIVRRQKLKDDAWGED